VDGGDHFTEDAMGYDQERQACIGELGIRFLRFTNDNVRKNLYAVLGEIMGVLKD